MRVQVKRIFFVQLLAISYAGITCRRAVVPNTSASPRPATGRTPTIVFVIRHADRKPDPEDDLTPAGILRARLLTRILAESGVQTVFCSSAERALKTIQPLKDLLGDRLEIVTVCVRSTTHVQQVVDGVKALPENAVTAVVGHSDTVRLIIEGLSGRTIDKIASHEFDKLFVVSTASAGVSTVALTRYGEPT